MRNPWSLSEPALGWLEIYITENRHQHIIECGSGLSTVMLNRMKQAGQIKHYTSLEHDSRYHNQTAALCKELPDELLLCPLEQTGHGTWYDPLVLGPVLAAKPFHSLVIVDGPPYHTGNRARYPAVPILKPYLKSGATVILDDANRVDEGEVIKQWITKWGMVLIGQVPTDKGMAVLKLP